VAQFTDPNLVNAWGIAAGAKGPFWVSANGSGLATLYTVANGTVTPGTFNVSIPGGSPTGQVHNDTTDFALKANGKPAAFIFASEAGTVSAWNGGLGVTGTVPAETEFSDSTAVFKGLTMISNASGNFLLASDFHNGRI